MSNDEHETATDRVIGKVRPRSWLQVRCDEPLPFAAQVQTSAGHGLARDPVGFPHVVILRCPYDALPEAGKLRLMKAFAWAVEEVRSGTGDGLAVRIELKVAPDASAAAELGRGPVVTLSPAWLQANNADLVALRRAARELVQGRGEAMLTAQPASAVRDAGPLGKVLLYKNVFTKDVDGRDALQVNPGMHYLISALRAAGAELVLLDGKHPLQDVCERPPDVNDRLAPEGFITDPEELERALADHPDLSLVCFTLLEKSFSQVRDLCRFVRERSRAFIAVGGVFPTVTPEHCFAHLPDANFVVRGDGEQVLPALARVVAGRTIDQGLDAGCLDRLGRLHGVIARCGDVSVAAGLDEANRVMELDESVLDFAFFERENVEGGLSLSTSRGCIYSCRFCSVMDKTHWRGRSVEAVVRDLQAYAQRIEELYGSAAAVPATARELQIWDDDFFIEPRRAAALLGEIETLGFTATFLQGTVASFFRRDGRTVTRELNEELLDAIHPSFFAERGGLKIGTENFNDTELKRLGKPYDFDRVRALVRGLGRRGIRQDHFRILCNRQTTLNELLDNLEKITALRWEVGPSFSVLDPSWLMNLFPSALYRSCQVQGTDLGQPHAGVLREDGYPELDYPFVLPERPAHREVFEVVRRFPSGMHYGAAGQPDWLLEGVYDTDDVDYLQVFDGVRRALEQRRAELRAEPGRDAAEQYRIERALETRLAGKSWIPRGVLVRVAPALALEGPEVRPESVLSAYLESLLTRAVQQGELDGRYAVRAELDGAALEVELGGARCAFLVQRYQPGAPCAFHTQNLAVIVQSAVDDEASRQRVAPIIDILRDIVQRYDTTALD
ncbi:MAG: cobalamin-dependent protein [bacterium]